MDGWKDGCLTWINLLCWMCVPLCDAASPVKKSADDPNSHQELNHQGQVDFPYETFSERKRAHSRKSDNNNNNHEQRQWSREAGRIVFNFFSFLSFRCISKCLLCFHQTHISSSHLKWAVLRGWKAEAGYSRDQETTFNFKSISRKTLREQTRE